MNLGILLKQLRVKKELTLADVAKAVDLTASSLSQIENGKISPSISTLETILRYYHVPMSDFFKQAEHLEIVAVKKDEMETITIRQGILISLLASKLQNNTLESYDVELQPECGMTLKELPHDINGERFIVVRDGDIHVGMGNESFRLQKGDSINFKAYFPCTITNCAKKTSRFFITGMPPIL